MGALEGDRIQAILEQAQQRQKSSYEKRLTPNRYGNKIPFLIGRDSDAPENYKSFWINPSQCGWKVGTRTTIEKVAGGAIHHEWPSVGLGAQESEFLLDHPIVSFTFQSGAIALGAHDVIDSTKPSQIPENRVPEGLGNFYDFIEILNKSNLSAGGLPNYVNIFYTSNIFPNLWLQGFFTEEGVNWDDSADSPNQITNWGASFMVFSSTPNFGSGNLRSAFETYGFQAWGA